VAPVFFAKLLAHYGRKKIILAALTVAVLVLAAAVGAAANTAPKEQSRPVSPATEPDFKPPPALSAEEVHLIARVIEGEAAQEPYQGRVAVGAVIMNRVKHPDFPNSVEEVVYQPRAFCVVGNGLVNRTPSKKSILAAQEAARGHDPTGGALYFWNPNKPVNSWVWTRTPLVTIGNHTFAH